MEAFFVSDLHGKKDRYNKLFSKIISEKPQVVFLGGDLYPSFQELLKTNESFFDDFFVPGFQNIQKTLGTDYPSVFIILGNDDPATEAYKFELDQYKTLWNYIHFKTVDYKGIKIVGYSFIPPTPFLNKDWEVYDVSRYVDPGCVHPTEGKRSIDPDRDIEFSTIKNDLETLTKDIKYFDETVFLFHSPPYQTNLDRAGLDNMFFDHVPLDVNVGSIAIKEFIEEKQPLLTLHGHIHESTRITGCWKHIIGKTVSFNAAIDTNKLSIIIFDLKNPKDARQEIL